MTDVPKFNCSVQRVRRPAGCREQKLCGLHFLTFPNRKLANIKRKGSKCAKEEEETGRETMY